MKTLTALTLGALLGLAPAAHAASKEEEAANYTKILKTSKDAKEKARAAEEIGRLGQIKKSFATEAVPYLIDALKDKDAKLRAAAAVAVGKVDADPEKVVPALTDL